MRQRPSINDLIVAIRNSHPDMVKLYTEGRCYEFTLILRSQYPSGEIWYSHSEGHAYFKYAGKYWDIRGSHHSIPKPFSELNHQDGHRPHRWGNGDKRRLVDLGETNEG